MVCKIAFSLVIVWMSIIGTQLVARSADGPPTTTSDTGIQFVEPRDGLTHSSSDSSSIHSGSQDVMCLSPSLTLKDQIAKLFQEHPELVMDVLRNQEIVVADIAARGVSKKASQKEYQRRLAELENPYEPELSPARPIRGNPDAPVTIVEYSDFECPYCGAVHRTIKQVLKQYGDQVRLVYKHNPLEFHPMAEPAARYFEAIALQDHEQAWLFHDQIFEQQTRLEEGEAALQAIVNDLSIDHQQLKHDLESEAVGNQIQKDREEAEAFGFDGTPAFVINGVSLLGNQPIQEFEQLIELAKSQRNRESSVSR